MSENGTILPDNLPKTIYLEGLTPGYPIQQPPAYSAQQPPMQGFTGVPTGFANGVAAADSILPPQMFVESRDNRVD